MRLCRKRKRITDKVITVFLSMSMVISTVLLPGTFAMGQNVYADSSSELPFIVSRTDYGVQDKDVSAVRVTIKPNSGAYFIGYQSDGEKLMPSGPMIICHKLTGSRYIFYLLGPSGEIVHTWETSSESDYPKATVVVNADFFVNEE